MAELVVIGASSGGVEALSFLCAALPADLPAAVLVVQHIGPHPSMLADLLGRRSPLPVAFAEDGETARPGTVRLAPPDRHLLVEHDGVMRLSRASKENHARPAVDPLFRSAALAFGPRAVGVVLTGHLDDGSAGLQAVQACGGVTVVQDPHDAAEPSMPRSALRHVAVDHCVPLRAMPALLDALARAPAAAPTPAADGAARQRLLHEMAAHEGGPAAMSHLRAIGEPSALACPSCHGGLWRLRGEPPHWRCHTGHAFGATLLLEQLCDGSDGALRSALRAVHETEALVEQVGALALGHEDDAQAQAWLLQLRRRLSRRARLLQALLRRPLLPTD